MKRYVEVSRAALEGLLSSSGFRREAEGREVTYVRDHHVHPAVHVKVYTSLSSGEDVARACGADAIRVVVYFDDGEGKSFGVGRFPKILRTGSEEKVLARLLARMREAYARANEWVKLHPPYDRSPRPRGERARFAPSRAPGVAMGAHEPTAAGRRSYEEARTAMVAGDKSAR